MVKRLQADLEGERLQATAYTEQLESEFHINKDIEERVSLCVRHELCWAIRPGRHGASQRLHGGAEDARHRRGPRRDERGHGVCRDSGPRGPGLGGSGAGSTGIHVDADDEWAKEMYMEPQFVTELQGEEATSCSASVRVMLLCALLVVMSLSGATTWQDNSV